MKALAEALQRAGIVTETKRQPLDRRVHNIHPQRGLTPTKWGFLTGQYALDVATLAGVHVQSLSYGLGKSPELFPWALRYAPDDAYIDLDRLSWWDKWRLAWVRIGGHYYQNMVTDS